MTKIVLAAHGSVPLPAALDPWVGTTHTLIGPDGFEINLTDYSGRTGAFLTREGVRGLDSPPRQAWTTSSPATDGEDWIGERFKPRDVTLPLFIFASNGTAEYIDWEDEVFHVLDSGAPCQWRVRTPRSDRTLTMRFVDDGDHQETFDTPLRGWARYTMHLIANDPWWKATAPRRRSWANTPSKPFFGGTMGGYGPPYYISRGQRIGSATMPNLGDVDGWPKWTLKGPGKRFELEVNSQLAVIDHDVADGDFITYDTDPRHRGVFDSSGAFIPGAATTPRFEPIPPGKEVPIHMGVDNLNAAISCELQERFKRARGSVMGGGDD